MNQPDHKDVPRASRRSFLKWMLRLIAVGGLQAVSGVGYMARVEPGWLAVERLQIPVANLPPAFEGYRLLQMSDLHLQDGRSRRMIRRAISTALKLEPDLIAITGDYVTGPVDTAALVEELSRLEAPDGVWTAMGNHDHWSGVEVVRQALSDTGIVELRNASTAISREGNTIFLAGVDDIWEEHHDLDAALYNVPTGATTILMAHEPDYADDVWPTGRVDLQLSGHSHGGQVRIPLIGAPVLPYLGRKYEIGLRRLGEMWLYTNRGIGYLIPVRFNCRPEITEFTLVGM